MTETISLHVAGPRWRELSKWYCMLKSFEVYLLTVQQLYLFAWEGCRSNDCESDSVDIHSFYWVAGNVHWCLLMEIMRFVLSQTFLPESTTSLTMRNRKTSCENDKSTEAYQSSTDTDAMYLGYVVKVLTGLAFDMQLTQYNPYIFFSMVQKIGMVSDSHRHDTCFTVQMIFIRRALLKSIQ